MQKSAFLSLIEKRAVCLFASHGGLGGRLDEVCFQTGVTHYVCVFSCWAEGWMVIMAFSTTVSSRFNGWKDILEAGLLHRLAIYIFAFVVVLTYSDFIFSKHSLIWVKIGQALFSLFDSGGLVLFH